MQKGTVKFFNKAKGFGFIIDSETKKDIFVHISDVDGEIDKDVKVTFEVKEGKKGRSAVNVRRA